MRRRVGRRGRGGGGIHRCGSLRADDCGLIDRGGRISAGTFYALRSANPPGFSPALLRGGAGLRAALALQAVGLCATSSTSHHEASKLMRFSPNYWQTCARRRIRVSALHRSHASPSPLSRHGPHREHGCHH